MLDQWSRPCSALGISAGPTGRPGRVIYTGPDEPNVRVVREMDTRHDDDPEWFAVLVVEEA